jgi:hypothetical protein
VPGSTDGAQTLDALMQRQKEIALREQATMQQPAINVPQGMAQMAWALVNGLQARQARREEGQAHADVAKALGSLDPATGTMTPEASQLLASRDPDLWEKIYSAGLSLAAQKAKQENWIDIPAPEGSKAGQRWQKNTVNGELRAVGGQPITQVGSGETEFDKTAGAQMAKSMIALADDAVKANADDTKIRQLEGFLGGRGGAVTGLKAWAASMGIPVEGADDMAAAQALIASLVPAQREPGSGTMSDRDVELFKSALPRWLNQPGGNKKILGVLKSMVAYRREQGLVAQKVLSGAIPREQAYGELMKIQSPMRDFPLPVPVGTDGEMVLDGLSPGQLYEYPNGNSGRYKGGDPNNPASWDLGG